MSMKYEYEQYIAKYEQSNAQIVFAFFKNQMSNF